MQPETTGYAHISTFLGSCKSLVRLDLCERGRDLQSLRAEWGQITEGSLGSVGKNLDFYFV